MQSCCRGDWQKKSAWNSNPKADLPQAAPRRPLHLPPQRLSTARYRPLRHRPLRTPRHPSQSFHPALHQDTPRQYRLPCADRSEDDPDQPASDDYLWTWKLVDCGLFSPHEILAIRRIDRPTFCDHLIRSVDAGKQVLVSSIFDEEQLQRLRQLTAAEPANQIGSWLNPDIRQQLPEELENQEVLLFLKCHACR